MHTSHQGGQGPVDRVAVVVLLDHPASTSCTFHSRSSCRSSGSPSSSQCQDSPHLDHPSLGLLHTCRSGQAWRRLNNSARLVEQVAVDRAAEVVLACMDSRDACTSAQPSVAEHRVGAQP